MSVGSQEPASPQPHAAHPLSTTQSPHVSSKIGPAAPNGFEPGFGRGGKPQKPGEDCPVPVSVPYLFVASEVPEPPAPTPYSPLLCLPRIWEWEWAGSPARPPPTENGYGAGFMNGHRLGTQSGPAAQNGYAAGFGRGVKPQKPGYGTGPGSRALPAVVGAQPGLGLGGGAKSQKPGYGNGNGLGAQPGLGGGVKPQVPGFGNGKAHGLGTQPGPPAQNGYRAGPVVPIGYGPGVGGGMKAQKPGYRNGLGAGAFLGAGAQPGAQPGLGGSVKPQKPGYLPGNGLGVLPGLGVGVKPQKPRYGSGNGLGAQQGDSLFLRVSKVHRWPPRSQGVSGSSPLSSIFLAGYQPPNGYGPRAELGFGGGLKPQKIDFGYRNGGLRPEVFPEARPQPGFPGANGFGNGHGEEALMYPEAAAPDLEKMVRLWPFRALPGPPSSPGELPPSLSMQLEPGAPIQGWGASQGPMKS
ncbi:glycine-rich extracellular protein 1 isoform X2 [Loxodonta africana]|uniref:glycine-rich extracellular protein 1 isoform X2 n=1 Tax=Loxodonta africana TaxID=9785 RepID=UPI0030D0D321